MVVPYRDAIGLFDLDNASSSHLTRKFLERAEKEGRVEAVGDDIPKSFVVCGDKRRGQTVYLSQMATATLLRRAENNSFE